jgi:hypothetical protein
MSHSRWPLLIAVAASLLGLALRVGVAEKQGLWADEVFSLALATGHSLEHPAAVARAHLGDYVESPRPLPPSAYRAYAEHGSPLCGPSRVFRAVFLSDTSPPLYYLLLYAWTLVLGTSDMALRSLSLLFAALCFPLLWSLGRQLGGRWTASAAVVLFTFAPLSVYYATEGRMYSLVWFTMLAVAYLTHRLYRRGATTAVIALWVLASAAGLLTHYFFAFPWAALVAWVLLFGGRSTRAGIVAGVVATCLVVAPWYVHLPETFRHWRVTQGWLNSSPGQDRKLPKGLLKLLWSYVAPAGPWWGYTRFPRRRIVNVLMTASLVVAAFPARRFFTRRRMLMLWFWLSAALLSLPALDLLGGTNMTAQIRYGMAGMPAAHLILALALRHARPLARALVPLAFSVCWAPAYFQMFDGDTRNSFAYRGLGRLLARQARESDLVLVNSIPTGIISVARCLENDSALERGAGLASWVQRLGVRRVPEDLHRLASGKRRIFLVDIYHKSEPSPELDWLRGNARLVSEDRLDGASVYGFAPRGGSTFPGRPCPDPLVAPPAASTPDGGLVRVPVRR